MIIINKFAVNTKQGPAWVVIHGQNGPAYLLLAKKHGGKFCFLKSFGHLNPIFLKEDRLSSLTKNHLNVCERVSPEALKVGFVS